MTENSVIKHYKKQLIYRQSDLPDQNDEKKDTQHVTETDNNKIYDFVESDTKNDGRNAKKTRKKRKNKNCRGQFRHEGMELIKLGTNTSHSLCKTKEPYVARIEKEKPQSEPIPNKEDVPVYQNKAENLKETNKKSVIQSSYVDKTIILENPPLKASIYGHALPQMVPERRDSREFNPTKVPTVACRSPPRPPIPQPDYRVPIHPAPYIPPHPTYSPLQFRPYPRVHSPHLPPPPPYPLARSPPRPVPRSPVRPVPQPPLQPRPPYTGIHFPFPRDRSYTNGYPLPPPNPPVRPIPQHPHEYSERKKRKHLEEAEKVKETPPVVAAIDLTVDQNQERAKKHHKCHCECGKTYASDPVTQEVIITVADNRESSQVPTYFRGKMMNGVLKLDTDSNDPKNKQNGAKEEAKPPSSDKKAPEGKLPQLFLIKDLLAKGVRVEKKPSPCRIANEGGCKGKSEEKTNVPIRTEPNRVIVSTGKPLDEPVRRKSQDYSVSNIIGTNNRRQSVDIDTISISSSSSESVRSPRPKSNGLEKQIPRGKLCYLKTNNSFIRYFDDNQKKLFMDNLIADGSGCDAGRGEEHKEIIELPRSAVFSGKDSLTVEEYVSEMTLAEKYIPKDFFLFYKFVTGYQICNNNLPVSFLTFLKIYNTNGLKVLYERYISSLKQTS